MTAPKRPYERGERWWTEEFMFYLALTISLPFGVLAWHIAHWWGVLVLSLLSLGRAIYAVRQAEKAGSS